MALERTGETQIKDSNEVAYERLHENGWFNGERIVAIINGFVVYKGFDKKQAILSGDKFKKTKNLSPSTPTYIRERNPQEIFEDSLLPPFVSFE